MIIVTSNHFRNAVVSSMIVPATGQAPWERWGVIEELTVQIYRPALSSFIAELNQSALRQAQSHIPVSVGILHGLKDLPVPMSMVEQQVQAVRQRGLAGVSFFFYETLTGRDRAIQTLFNQPLNLRS